MFAQALRGTKEKILMVQQKSKADRNTAEFSVLIGQMVCYLLDGISKGAWLNRSSIIFAGNDKWSVDPRVSIVSNMGDKHEYSLQIQKVDVTDEGFYTCSIQSERNPRPKLIQLIVKAPP
ncbi:hypothetical protein QTP70_027917 [Hemibagrus guttatus]|uniref:Immunoglobulin V-set domain-containing protein n=1 Tax=Hemibagrus guttatus TaxID=175788 RepID=A0AAE0RKX2_9TELE|nr:hypothetical protein QTP70_027917 [Hemibagrus guttatus]